MSKVNLAGRPPKSVLLACAALCLIFAAGCGINKPSSNVPLTLRAGGAMAVRTATSLTSIGTTMMGSGCDSVPVTYTKVLLVVRSVQFNLAENEADDDSAGDDDGGDHDIVLHKGNGVLGGDDGEDGDDDDHGDHAVAVTFTGPFVVDLLTHTADSLDTQLVPPGNYRSTTGRISPLQAGDWNAPQFEFLVGSTVYLQGTVNGEGGGEFTYKAAIEHRFKIKGNFTVSTGTPATAFLVFDTSQWLCGNGRFLDPRDPANDAAIQQAIIRSIRVGMDDNHDGKCDDRTHGEND